MEGPTTSKNTKEPPKRANHKGNIKFPNRFVEKILNFKMCFNFHQQICALFTTNYKLNMVELNLIDFNPNSIEEIQNANWFKGKD